MKNLKKILSIILAIITVIAAISGCLPEDDKKPSVTTAPISPPESITKAPEQTTDTPQTYPDDIFGSDGLVYQRIPDGYKIVSVGSCNDKNIIIPKTHKNLLVVEIEKRAFIGAMAESIFVPDTVKTIGDYAFENCISLKEITFSEGLETVGGYLFKGAAIEEVVMPKSVINYPRALGSVFAGCSTLKRITLGGRLENAGTDLGFLGNPTVEEITFAEGYRIVSDGLFKDMPKLKKVNLPSTIEYVGPAFNTSKATAEQFSVYVFPEGKSLITCLKDSPASFGNDLMFFVASGNTDRYNVKEYAFPEGIISIGDLSFQMNYNFEFIHLPSSLRYIGPLAFSNCLYLKSVILSDGITEIAPSAFFGCNMLEYNEYGNALYLGTANNPYFYLVMAKSTDITSVNIHVDTKHIASAAFRGCTNLSEITVPDGVKRIGTSAFEGCASLEKLVLPLNLERGSSNLIKGCHKLNTLYLPASMYNTYNLLSGCSMEKLIIKDGIRAITYKSFDSNSNLSEISIEAPVEVIGERAFHNCKNLATVFLPKTIKKIEAQAFLTGGEALSITYPGTKAQFLEIDLDKNWFGENTAITVICSDGELTANDLKSK